MVKDACQYNSCKKILEECLLVHIHPVRSIMIYLNMVLSLPEGVRCEHLGKQFSLYHYFDFRDIVDL